MDDAGRTMFGFIFVWLTIQTNRREARSISPIVILWLTAVPIFDLFACIVRRVRKGRSAFQPGRDHIHYTLTRARKRVRCGYRHSNRSQYGINGHEANVTFIGRSG